MTQIIHSIDIRIFRPRKEADTTFQYFLWHLETSFEPLALELVRRTKATKEQERKSDFEVLTVDYFQTTIPFPLHAKPLIDVAHVVNSTLVQQFTLLNLNQADIEALGEELKAAVTRKREAAELDIVKQQESSQDENAMAKLRTRLAAIRTNEKASFFREEEIVEPILKPPMNPILASDVNLFWKSSRQLSFE